MSRSGYSDDCGGWELICWRGAVASAIRGKRGQNFLKKLKEALEALPQKKLSPNLICRHGEVCAIGSLVLQEGGEVTRFEEDIENGIVAETLADHFNVAPALVKEIMFENDDGGRFHEISKEDRYHRMLRWVNEAIKDE